MDNGLVGDGRYIHNTQSSTSCIHISDTIESIQYSFSPFILVCTLL